jgi:hypothetical protein
LVPFAAPDIRAAQVRQPTASRWHFGRDAPHESDYSNDTCQQWLKSARATDDTAGDFIAMQAATRQRAVAISP